MIDSEDCYSVSSADLSRRVWICRVEHIVAWVLRGATWDDGQDDASSDGRLKLTRFRAGTASELVFDDPERLREWASAGGPWRNTRPKSV